MRRPNPFCIQIFVIYDDSELATQLFTWMLEWFDNNTVERVFIDGDCKLLQFFGGTTIRFVKGLAKAFHNQFVYVLPDIINTEGFPVIDMTNEETAYNSLTGH